MISLLNVMEIVLIEFILIWAWFLYFTRQELKQKLALQKKEQDKKINSLRQTIDIFSENNKNLQKSSQALYEKLKALEIIRIDMNTQTKKLEQCISQLQRELYCARKRSKKLVNLSQISIK